MRLSSFVRRWRSGAARRFRSRQVAVRRGPHRQPEELRLAAHEELIEAELALGRHADVVAGQILARCHPDARASASPANAGFPHRSGRQSEALQAYQDVRRVLATEAGPSRARHFETSSGRSFIRTSSSRRRRPAEQYAVGADTLAQALVRRRCRRRRDRRGRCRGDRLRTHGALERTDCRRLRERGREAGRGRPRRRRAHPGWQQPLSIVLGLGSAWTLNAGDQTISRIDLATQRVVADSARALLRPTSPPGTDRSGFSTRRTD